MFNAGGELRVEPRVHMRGMFESESGEGSHKNKLGTAELESGPRRRKQMPSSRTWKLFKYLSSRDL